MARSRQYPLSVDPGAPIEPTLPPGWSRHAFGDLFEVIERPVTLRDTETYQLVNARRSRGGIVPRERLTGDQIRVRNQFLVEAGDFLISKRQIIHGACGIVPPSLAGAVVSNEYAVLRPRLPLTTEYLRYLPELPYFQRTCFHSSVGVDVEKMVFKLDQWFRFNVPLPRPGEQVKIAKALSSVDDAISKTEALIEQLEVAKKALLRRRFVEQPSGELKAISAVAKVVGGFGFAPDAQGRTDLPYAFFKVSDMSSKGNEIELKFAANSVDSTLLTRLKAKTFPAGTVVFPKVGAALLTNKRRVLSTESTFDNNVMGLVPCGVQSRYLLYFMSTIDFSGMVQPGALPSVNGAMVGALQIPVPSESEQVRIAAEFAAMDEAMYRNRSALAGTRDIRRGLLDSLLSGRVRVSVTAQEAA